MKTPSIVASIAVTFILGGCSTIGSTWAPFPQDSELTSFASRWKDASKQGTSVLVLQRTLVTYRDEIYTAAMTRSRLEWDATGLSTYGGLAAVIGGVAHQIGLLNTGIAVATLGMTNSSRYMFHQQTQIYVSALKRIACITGKVNSVSDGTLMLAQRASDSAASETARNFIDIVVASVDYVRTEYTNGLLGLAPTVPTREELLGFTNTYRAQAPGGAAAGIANPDPAADAAGIAVKTLASDIQICSKL